MIRPFGISICLTLAVLASTAEAQLIRIGPYGGVRLRAPGVRLSVPAPVGPPIYPSPFGMSRFYGPPVPVPSFGYRVNRIPVYVPQPTYVPPAAPRFEMEYYGPGGSGSISVGSAPAYPVGRAPVAQVEYQAADPLDLESHLYDAATRLTRSLSSRRDGDPWMTYLAPHRITAALERGETTALKELVDHYNGVAANPKLSAIANLDGFQMTRRLLPRFLESLDGQSPTERPVAPQPLSEQDNGESLLPTPEPLPNEPQPEPSVVPEPNAIPEPAPAPEPRAVPELAPQAVPAPVPNGPSPAEPIVPADGPAAL